jgi:hypothetical protein
MKDLVGRSFAIAEQRYLVVDVQRTGGDALVYTRRLDGSPSPADTLAGRQGPRTAFHYRDIAAALAAGQHA